jgi:hypothetical protein
MMDRMCSSNDDDHDELAATEESVRDLLSEFDELLSLTLTLKAEKDQLEEQITVLREDRDLRIKANAELGAGLIREAVRELDLSDRCLELEELNSDLANLYVAIHRIHSSLDREQVLTAIQEVIVNQIGSEEFAILERDDDGARLWVAVSVGIEDARMSHARVVLDVLASGAVYIRGASGGEPSDVPAVCIPLRVGDRVTGVIVIRSLLCHKERVEPPDYELCNLLATHGGIALFSSRLYARARAEERSR